MIQKIFVYKCKGFSLRNPARRLRVCFQELRGIIMVGFPSTGG